MSFLVPKNKATAFVDSLCSRIILRVIVIGTERNIPLGPSKKPQIIKPAKTIKVDSPKPFPIIFGSRKVPIPKLATRYRIDVQSIPLPPNWINDKAIAGSAAINEPILGI